MPWDSAESGCAEAAPDQVRGCSWTLGQAGMCMQRQGKAPCVQLHRCRNGSKIPGLEHIMGAIPVYLQLPMLHGPAPFLPASALSDGKFMVVVVLWLDQNNIPS